MTVWRPVDCAPTGEWVLCRTPERKLPVILLYDGEDWVSSDSDGEFLRRWNEGHGPTHWQNLPEMPND